MIKNLIIKTWQDLGEPDLTTGTLMKIKHRLGYGLLDIKSIITTYSLMKMSRIKRIKTVRVKRLIDDCQYWLASNETELFQESLAELIEAAGQDHPLVIQYPDHLTKLGKI